MIVLFVVVKFGIERFSRIQRKCISHRPNICSVHHSTGQTLVLTKFYADVLRVTTQSCLGGAAKDILLAIKYCVCTHMFQSDY